MQKKSAKCQFLILFLMFIVGFLAFALPIISELSSYQADEEEYKESALEIRPPVQTPIPPLPVRIASPPPEATEHPTYPTQRVGAISPTATPEESLLPEVTQEPEPVMEEEKADSHVMVPTPEIGATHLPHRTTTDTKPDPTPTKVMLMPTSARTTPEPQPAFDFSACLTENKDFVAWLTIPGTKIDYPVVRSDNTAYYLKHMFSGKESKLGSLFSLRSSDYQKPSRNIAIYGHHLSNSDAMFTTLLKYKSASYQVSHSIIRLDTLYGSRSYRIFAVVNMKVSDWDPATASFSSNESFLRFVNRAVCRSLYDTGVSVDANDNILTLITCDRSYGGASGRLLVMAVEQK